MKTLITLLAIAFSANSFAHGFYLSPSQQITLSPFLGTSFTALSVEVSTDATSSKKASYKLLQDVQEYHMSGVASAALTESIKQVQSMHEVSSDESVDMLVEMAKEILAN